MGEVMVILVCIVILSLVLVGVSIEIHERCLVNKRMVLISKLGFCIAVAILITVLILLVDISPLLVK